jgi:hypothetical protein
MSPRVQPFIGEAEELVPPVPNARPSATIPIPASFAMPVVRVRPMV